MPFITIFKFMQDEEAPVHGAPVRGSTRRLPCMVPQCLAIIMSSLRRQTALIKRSSSNVDKKFRSMPIISRRRTPAPTPPPPAVSVSLKKVYNFVTKFAFDIYGEICEGKSAQVTKPSSAMIERPGPRN
jgi:hypothetical protein